MTPTPRQREAIESWTHGDVCVVAGPGSGKTLVLVERFKWLVEAKGIPVRRILAITFTEKAAANMRRRLVEAFPAASRERKAVERAYISTIHAFCARLLRENAIEAAVDPEFRVLDEWEADFQLEKAIEETLEHEYQERPERVREFLSRFGSNDVHGSLFVLHHAIRAAGVSIEEAARIRQPIDPRETRQKLVEAFQQLNSLSTFGWSYEQRNALREVISAGPEQLLKIDFNLNHFKRGSRQVELLKVIREELIPACKAAMLFELNQQNRQWFLDVLAQADCLYSDRKRAAAALDYSDLEESAVRLLEAAGTRLRSAFSYILMDEFQDTNPLQSRLVDLLRGTGNFFAVGDINQSIYGFRHADPTVFRAFREKTLQSGGHVVPLLENFRSRPELLDAVKKIIAGADGVEPQDLVAGRSFPPPCRPALESFAVRADDGDEALKIEALHVSARIQQLCAESGFHYGDIAILLRTSAQVRVFEQALRQQGVPCEVTEAQGFYDAREVNDLLCFLRILLNPLDEISLAAVLRSPLAGVSDDELFRLKRDFPSLMAGVEAASDPVLERFRSLLERFRRDWDYTPLDRLLGRLLTETGYEAWLLEQPTGAHRAANVRKLLALARRFHASGLDSLQGFVERVEDLRRDKVREPEARPPEQSADAVQVMTVHSAKGLEFPVVFLPAINRRPRSEPEAVTFSPRIGVGMRWLDPETGGDAADALAQAVADEAKLNRREESQRLFYVAMTRAEELLVLSASFGQQIRVEQWAALVQRNLAFDFKQSRIGIPACPVKTEPGQARMPVLLDRPEVQDQSDTSVSATSVALFAQCPRRYYLSRYLGFDLPRQTNEAHPPDEMDSTEFGRHVHALLAGALPRESATPEALALISNFESSMWGRRAASAGHLEREHSFLVSLDGRLLSGQIDLWFRESGETILIDYKTDDVTAQQAPHRAADYEVQLRLYALAIQRLSGASPDRAILYFLRPNLPLEVSLDLPSLDAARVKVEELFQAQSRVDFPLRVGEHCFRCPHFHGICPAR